MTGTAEDPKAIPDELPLTPEQRMLVEEGVPLIEQCATELASRYPGLVSARELLGAGGVALHEAARTYVPEKHPSFSHYARHHVYGRMIDALRIETFSLRARVEAEMERSWAMFTSRQNLGIEFLFDSDDELRDKARQGCDDMLAAVFFAGMEAARPTTPEDELASREEYKGALTALDAALATLNPSEREVVTLVYRARKTLDEIGREIGMHANTAQRRHMNALRRLRMALLVQGVTRAPAPRDLEVQSEPHQGPPESQQGA